MPPAPSRQLAREKLRTVNTLSVAIAISALAHTAAIGALLTVKPPRLAPALQMIQISLVPVEALVPASNLSGAIPGDRSIRPDVSATASPPNWPESGNWGHLIDVPALPPFKPHARSRAFDRLGTILDCPVVEGSTLGASGRPRPHCASADLPFRVPEPSGSGVRADDGHQTFKPDQSVFDESPFPDDVPPAVRALEKWILGLFVSIRAAPP